MSHDRSNYFRRDIEGLRAVAVLLVLLFHAALPPYGGYVGVDVFFVISGYLITGLLTREAARTGTISLTSFYAKRARRLLPAASLVLLTTVPLIRFLAPATEREEFGLDVAGAAAYFVNWRFAERSVDYLAEDVGRSPVLHFWSLSVEEQFYFIWPLIIVAALFFARRSRVPMRGYLTLALLLVLLPSFGWSLFYSSDSPEPAFFVTTTRLWELSIGAILALNVERLQKLGPHIASGFGAVGALLLLGSAAIFNEDTDWPGYLALVPTIGAALLITAGSITRDGAIQKFLGSTPMVWLGGISYSLYLWHWPIIVVGQDWFDLRGPRWGSALVVLSLIPAWLSYRFVETPFRYSTHFQTKASQSVSVGFNLSLLCVVAGLLLSLDGASATVPQGNASIGLEIGKGRVTARPTKSGAGILGRHPGKSEAGKPKKRYIKFSPKPQNAKKDVPKAYSLGCQTGADEIEPAWCEVGQKNSSTTIVVAGDSKILQYYDALDVAGKALNWRLRIATKSACSFTHAFLSESCATFRDIVLNELRQDPPDFLITSQSFARASFSEETEDERSETAMREGLHKLWSEIVNLGTEVIVVLDNPHPPHRLSPIFNCLKEHSTDMDFCAFSRKEGIQASAALVQKQAAQGIKGVHVVDLTDYICPQKQCAPVIGDITVLRQGSHITNTYVRTMAPRFTEALQSIVQTAQKK